MVTIEGGESRWINFKYNWLPNFCYNCGMLSHALRDCLNSSENLLQKNSDLQDGVWLRGEPIRRGTKDSSRSIMDGDSEGRGVADARSEKGTTHPCASRVEGMVGSAHVPRLIARGDAST